MRAKYHNHKTEVDGITFDSRMEAKRYVQLKDMQEAGDIYDLRLQPEYELIPAYKHNGKRVRKTIYRADFAYRKLAGKLPDALVDEYVIEDVKGVETEAFRLKKKLFEYTYPWLTITLVKR